MKKWWVLMLLVMAGITGAYFWVGGEELKHKDGGILVPPLEPTPTENVEKGFKFAVMADVHNDLDSLRKGMEIAKERGNEIVIMAGDLSINGTVEELVAVKKVLDESGVDYLVVPGNHDLYEGEGNYKKVFGKDYGVVEGRTPTFAKATAGKHGSARMTKIILINNGSWKGLGEIQEEWIKEEVKECLEIFCVAVAHMPLNHNFSEHVMGEDSKAVVAEARELLNILVQNNIKNIITGHLHYASSYEIEGLRTHLVGGMNKKRNNQTPRFTEFEMSENGVESEVVVL